MKKPQQIWLLWHKAKALGQRPSELLALQPDSYEAYCLDEAVIFFGMQLEGMLDEAGEKPDKESLKLERARQRVLDKIFGKPKDQGSGFADPAAMFK